MARRRRRDRKNKASAVAGGGRPAAELERRFHDAVQRFQSGDMTGARAQLSGIQARQADIPEVLHLRALVNLKTGNLEAACDDLRTAIGKLPGNAELRSLHGSALNQAGQGDLAVAEFEAALALDPRSADTHYNLANALRSLGRMDAAIEHYTTATELEPDFCDAYFNLGVALKEESRFSEALNALNDALAIRPGDVDALVNAANLHIRFERHEEARFMYETALAANPNMPECHYNLSLLDDRSGAFMEASKGAQAALELDPSHAEARGLLALTLGKSGRWDEAADAYLAGLSAQSDNLSLLPGLVILLIAMSSSPAHGPDAVAKFLDRLGENPDTAYLRRVVAYALSRRDGGVSGDGPDVLHDAISHLEPGPDSLLPVSGGDEANAEPAMPPRRIVSLLQWGRSGTGFLHCLLDGHPDISTMPGDYMKGFFGHGVGEVLASPDPGAVIRQFIDLYDVVFDARSPKAPPGHVVPGTMGLGVNEGYAQMGEDKATALSVDREAFARHLEGLLADHSRIGQGELFDLVHRAYELAIGRDPEKSLLFHHIHNPDTYELLNFMKHFPQGRFLMIIREPLQSCESWLSNPKPGTDIYQDTVEKLIEFLSGFDQELFRYSEAGAIRLEDLRFAPERTMARLCSWLGVEESACLYTPTMQGLTWWGDLSSVRFGRKTPVVGFQSDLNEPDKDPISRPIGHLFSAQDQLILKVLLYPLRTVFGYEVPEDGWLDAGLKQIEPFLDQPFDFERKIIDENFADGLEPSANMYYLALRGIVRQRWERLAAHGAYANMIQPIP